MTDTMLVLAGIALVAILVLVVVTFFRLGSIVRDRDGAAREATDLRARFEAFAQAGAEHERDMRGDLATARREQNETAVALRKEVGDRLLELTRTVEQKLDGLRNENAKKLDEMRATVDEKLQATLEQRLGASFKIVSDRLEQVHRGFGEMQALNLNGWKGDRSDHRYHAVSGCVHSMLGRKSPTLGRATNPQLRT